MDILQYKICVYTIVKCSLSLWLWADDKIRWDLDHL